MINVAVQTCKLGYQRVAADTSIRCGVTDACLAAVVGEAVERAGGRRRYVCVASYRDCQPHSATCVGQPLPRSISVAPKGPLPQRVRLPHARAIVLGNDDVLAAAATAACHRTYDKHRVLSVHHHRIQHVRHAFERRAKACAVQERASAAVLEHRGVKAVAAERWQPAPMDGVIRHLTHRIDVVQRVDCHSMQLIVRACVPLLDPQQGAGGAHLEEHEVVAEAALVLGALKRAIRPSGDHSIARRCALDGIRVVRRGATKCLRPRDLSVGAIHLGQPHVRRTRGGCG